MAVSLVAVSLPYLLDKIPGNAIIISKMGVELWQNTE